MAVKQDVMLVCLATARWPNSLCQILTHMKHFHLVLHQNKPLWHDTCQCYSAIKGL